MQQDGAGEERTSHQFQFSEAVAEVVAMGAGELKMVNRKLLTEIERRLVDDGKLIEAGWVGLQIAAIPKDASPTQLEEMRSAFFAGAQHLFACITDILDPGEEPTEKDLQRMDQIDKELRRFIQDFSLRHLPTDGTS